MYPNIALQPMPRGTGLSFPVPLKFLLLVSDNKDEAQPDTLLGDAGSSYIPSAELDSKAPHLIKEGELNNHVRGLKLTKQGAKLLAFKLQQ